MTSRLQWLVSASLVVGIAGAGFAYSVIRSADDGERNAPPTAKGKICCCRPPSQQEIGLALAAAAEKEGKPTEAPMFGGTPFRNMANPIDKGIPEDWSVEEGKEKNLAWSAKVGNKCYAGPVVADGKVFVGTNNVNPRDPNVKGPKAVLMAFAAADGKFLWQIAHDIPTDEVFKEAIPLGLCSTPVVEGKKLWYVTSGCEVVGATTDGKVEWKLDMRKDLKVIPYHLSNCSPLVVGDLLMLVTGNGIDEQKGKVLNPKAPSFLALEKNTGKIAWQSSLPGEAILEGQWSNPTLAVVDGKQQVVFPGGDSVLYALDPASGKLIWKFDCIPDRPKDGADDAPAQPYFIATPVFHDGKLYIGLGVYPEHPKGIRYSWFFCIDATKTGDVSPKNYDAKDPANKGSALVWAYGGNIEPKPKAGQRQVHFGKTISTAAIHDGLVYISEEGGYLHCLDAKTGQRYWLHDLKSGIWGSPSYVDGKVLIGNEDGALTVFAAGKEKKVLAEVDMGEAIDSTPVVAGGTLYLTTRSKVFAIREKK